jgi:hypothetical protein
MTVHQRYVSTLLALSLGCGSGPGPAPVESDSGSGPTGLEGTVHRGPTRAVCRVDNPCIAPFSATFELWQGERVVGRFRSDSAGHFLVHLAPGSYTVVPDSSVGILMRSQVHKVTVGARGLTHIDLSYDTGIS